MLKRAVLESFFAGLKFKLYFSFLKLLFNAGSFNFFVVSSVCANSDSFLLDFNVISFQ
jgi:hypothetical protein